MFQSQPRFVLFLLLAAAGCKGKAPATTDDAAPAPTVPADATAPVDAVIADAAGDELRVECPGGEKTATARALGDDGAELVVAHAGHFSQTYRFTFDGGRLTGARRDDTSWSFTGGLPDNPETKDKVKRVEYVFPAPGAPTCQTRTAEGPSKDIEALLERATPRAGRCEDTDTVQELATHLRAGEAGKAELIAVVCRP
jgi:hypothetical protein